MTLQVRLIVTPFLPIHQPALGVSSLLAVLEQAGIEADVAYYNLDYVVELSPELHLFITRVPQHCLLGEMLFAKALWGDAALSWGDYFGTLKRCLREQHAQYVSTGEVRHGERIGEMLDEAEPRLAELYEASPRIIKSWADDVLRANPRVVGFSTTFQQNNASLALAKELRGRVSRDRMLILFGGANCDEAMGQAIEASFPFVDCVVCGEGEEILLEIVKPLLCGPACPPPLPRFARARSLVDLNQLPPPNFNHYFTALRRMESAPRANLVAETSRGCWFGVKSHCKFCGLNGSTMTFRRKDPDHVIQELSFLSERYGSRRFMMTDNILDMRHLEDLLPRLAGQGFELFYEIKPNLQRRHLQTLRDAGVSAVQPGIESLDTSVLKLIAKGSTRLQNLQTLRWCFELDIDAYWSILYGFPGETREAYEQIAALIPLLVHLPPPMQVLPFQMHRFSPYFFDALNHGLHEVRPYWSYSFAYPGLADEERGEIAYCFEFRYHDRDRPEEFAAPVLAAVAQWDRAHHHGAVLTFEEDALGLSVLDSRRDEAAVRNSRLSLLEHDLLLDLGDITSRTTISQRFPSPKAALAIEHFIEEGWVISEGERLLSVIVDRQWRQHEHRRAQTVP